MDKLNLSRRAVGSSLTAAAGVVAFGPSAALSASWSDRLTHSTPSPLSRFMKVYAALTAQTVWYWYSGTLELAPQGASILPLVGIDTLIRRDVRPNADGVFAIVTSEANYFHGLHDNAPLESMVNPVTGRIVQPQHFTEGPRTVLWSEQSLARRKTEVIETSVEWREAGPYTWLYRKLYADAPHPLDMKQWPLEASGARARTGSFSTHCALTRDVADPTLASAPCSFTYEAICDWLPWLLMGQRPGRLLWRATGMKLNTLADLPAASRAGFERTFPAVFTGVGFGSGGENLWEQFRASRKPAMP